MENKYTRMSIDRMIQPISNAPADIKKSAEYDSGNSREPYGYFATDKKHSSFQSWFSDMNAAYSIVKNCEDLPDMSTMTTIIYYDKDGEVDGANHTSFDGRSDSLKKAIDSGEFANTDLTVTVFKDPESLVESFFEKL